MKTILCVTFTAGLLLGMGVGKGFASYHARRAPSNDDIMAAYQTMCRGSDAWREADARTGTPWCVK